MMKTGKKIGLIGPVNVVKPETGELLENVDIRIRGKRIESIEPSAGAAGSENFSGMFAIPGLIDTHVHAPGIFIAGNQG